MKRFLRPLEENAFAKMCYDQRTISELEQMHEVKDAGLEECVQWGITALDWVYGAELALLHKMQGQRHCVEADSIPDKFCVLENEKNWGSIKAVKKANKLLGHYWFTFESMSFFNTRIETDIIGARLFITSEKNEQFTAKAAYGAGFKHDTARTYSIRCVNDDGSIDTVGDFCAYATLEQAKDAVTRGAE